jgi:hypothetical protein
VTGTNSAEFNVAVSRLTSSDLLLQVRAMKLVFRLPGLVLATTLLPLFLTACSGDNGAEGGVQCETTRGTVAPGERVQRGSCESCICLADGTLDCEDICEADASVDTSTLDTDSADSPDVTPDVAAPGDVESDNGDAASWNTECQDNDNDGFLDCRGATDNVPPVLDCDDRFFSSQPGGYEFPGNDRDDDCDGTVDEPYACGCTLGMLGGTDAMLPAIDLCDGTVSSSTLSGSQAQFYVMPDYFDAALPRNGECFVVMSSGDANEQPSVPSLFNMEGVQPGTSFSEGTYPDPAPSPGAGVYDLAQWTIELDVPPNVQGFTFDFMFMSAEFPEYLCQEFNDTFYALLNTDAVNAGATTNISFDPNNAEITVNVGYFEKPTEWTVNLETTPFGVADTFTGGCPFLGGTAPGCALPDYCNEAAATDFVGSGSGWLRTAAPVTPGQQNIRLVFSIHDEGDSALDSLVLIDNFTWTQGAPEVGTVKQ